MIVIQGSGAAAHRQRWRVNYCSTRPRDKAFSGIFAPELQSGFNPCHLRIMACRVRIRPAREPDALRQEKQQQYPSDDLRLTKTLTRKEFAHWAERVFYHVRNCFGKLYESGPTQWMNES